MISRRSLMWAGLAAPALMATRPVWAQAAAPNFGTAPLPDPGYRRFKVGSGEVISLNDGVLRRPLAEEFVRNAPFDAVKAALAASGLPTDYIDGPYNVYLVLDQGRRILMDAGFADNGPAGTGRIVELLGRIGLQPGDIDTVLVSHFHGDHISGLRRKDGSLTFPNARVMVPQPEFDHWMSDERMQAAPQAARGGFANAKRVFGGMSDTQLVRFTPGAEVMPSISSIAAFGHSPGQTMFQWRSGSDRFTYLADIAHFPALFVRNPDWQVQFDMDAEAARQTRRSVLQRMVQEGGMVGGYHFPFPGVGRIAAEGSGYVFRAA